MRILFVSGVCVGGARRSTVELAEGLRELGHECAVLLGDRPGPGSLVDLSTRLSVKYGDRPGARSVRRLSRRPGRRLLAEAPSPAGVPIVRCLAPENALQAMLREHRPDVVVANSLPRPALRTIHASLDVAKIPLALYLREAHAITHLTISGMQPDLLLANSHHLAELAASTGHEAEVIPSAIDCRDVTTTSTRTAVLVVNPGGESRLDVVLGLAEARPDIPFVLQESWPMASAEWTDLQRRTEQHPNIDLRRAVEEPGRIYRDARILLATYRSGRPRVVVEARHNHIPTLAQGQPALAEAVGEAGILVSPDAPLTSWVTALASIWDDVDRYECLRRSCEIRARDEATDPARVAKRVADALSGASR